jgi:CheY-like chemotaxis protein
MADLFELASDTKAYILANEYANHNKHDRDIRRLAMALFRTDRELEIVAQKAAQWITQLKDQTTADQFLKDVRRATPGEFKKTAAEGLTGTVSRLPTRPSSLLRPAAPWRPPAEKKEYDTSEVEKALPGWLEKPPEEGAPAAGEPEAAAPDPAPAAIAPAGPMRIVRGTNRATQLNVEVRQATEKEQPGDRVRPILIVDDDRTFRDACAKEYRQAGYRVTSVGKAQAALHLLAGGNFSALQIDIELPDMSGLDFLRHALHTGLNLRRTPVVVCSKHGREALAEFSVDDHVIHFSKPADPVALLAAVTAAVKR